MTKITVPDGDARVEAAVRAGLEAAAENVWLLPEGWHDGISADYHRFSSLQTKTSAVQGIRAIAADPDAVARIAKGVAP